MSRSFASCSSEKSSTGFCKDPKEVVCVVATKEDRSYLTAKAVTWLRENFERTLNVDELASMAGMSRSTLHHHFRGLTAMSPLQFQKQLRLRTARQKMLTQELDAASEPSRSDTKVQASSTANTNAFSENHPSAIYRHCGLPRHPSTPASRADRPQPGNRGADKLPSHSSEKRS